MFGTGKVFDTGGIEGRLKCGDFVDLEIKRIYNSICL
jgi:hypothetical protein